MAETVGRSKHLHPVTQDPAPALGSLSLASVCSACPTPGSKGGSQLGTGSSALSLLFVLGDGVVVMARQGLGVKSLFT